MIVWFALQQQQQQTIKNDNNNKQKKRGGHQAILHCCFCSMYYSCSCILDASLVVVESFVFLLFAFCRQHVSVDINLAFTLNNRYILPVYRWY